ncbi:DegQ family serine endoprotease [Seleniivibrio woodruffii]|uniref:Probable periplasmic serine endoprotease DegP-like n=1 Tax=Seleniivibrio woodruffii TaxID=1078050 RepID=A0A4R1KDE0_9BACT|nr:DegQ family serine endoprotease [Seleniivibrio woodruffii]TCK62616.1 serine protease Do [Seleniivibrio woodruffii]TVZ36958.1 serine protease Do [Seleniivibrio woodruffii]
MKKFLLMTFIVCITAVSAIAAPAPESFSGIYKSTKDSVVNISTTKVMKRSAHPPINDEMFRRFFGDDFGGMIPNMPREFKTSSLGSGFIIDATGLIVTNNHVIDGASEIIVKLNDEHKFPAKVVGRDPLTDLALIKIEPGNLKLSPLPLGDSDKADIGDWVIAIGNPLGLEWTITAGIISAKGRELNNSPYDNFMQTDASINPGNSGGPLINMQGQVVAINTAIIPSGQGLGFAVPVNMLKDLLPKLKTGTVKRGWLGVSVQSIDEKLAKGFGMKEPKGALIADVTKDDPADKAGVKAGDVVLKVNGQAIADSKELVNTIGAVSPGQTVVLDILRDKKEMKISVKLGVRKGQGGEDESPAAVPGSAITVVPLNKNELTRLNLSYGVKVVNVDEKKKAYDAGLRPGTIILTINREQVRTAAEFNEKFNKIAKGSVVLLQTYAGGRSNFIAFDKD